MSSISNNKQYHLLSGLALILPVLLGMMIDGSLDYRERKIYQYHWRQEKEYLTPCCGELMKCWNGNKWQMRWQDPSYWVLLTTIAVFASWPSLGIYSDASGSIIAVLSFFYDRQLCHSRYGSRSRDCTCPPSSRTTGIYFTVTGTAWVSVALVRSTCFLSWCIHYICWSIVPGSP